MTSATDTNPDPRSEKSSRRFRIAPLVALVIVLALLALIAARYREAVAERAAFERESTAAAAAPAASKAAPAYRVTRGVVAQWQPSVAVSGTLAPIRESTLGFKVSGRLASVKVKVGDQVKAGTLLASLDASDIAAQLKAANAQVHSAEVSLEIAKDEEARSKVLLTQGAISDAQHRANTHRTELARAALEAAQAQAATVSAMLENTRLIAPFSGLVTLAPSAPGAVITPGLPGEPLLRVEDTSALRFTGTLTLEDAALLRVGTPIEIQGSPAKGSVTAVLPSVDPQTRRVPVLAEVANDASAPLLAGSFARAVFRSAQPIDVIKLPAEALRPGSQDEIVLVEAGRARVVRVTFARDDAGALLVRRGVSTADSVVLAPSASTKTGDAIQLATSPG
jgi:RND family efflux transporter MFP subunit